MTLPVTLSEDQFYRFRFSIHKKSSCQFKSHRIICRRDAGKMATGLYCRKNFSTTGFKLFPGERILLPKKCPHIKRSEGLYVILL